LELAYDVVKTMGKNDFLVPEVEINEDARPRSELMFVNKFFRDCYHRAAAAIENPADADFYECSHKNDPASNKSRGLCLVERRCVGASLLDPIENVTLSRRLIFSPPKLPELHVQHEEGAQEYLHQTSLFT